MTYQDKALTCKECGTTFAFSAAEQAFYAEKAFRMNLLAARSAVVPANRRPVVALPLVRSVNCLRPCAVLAV
ncbi:hypothetical protein TcarDRAFT_0661 [Thermosinus carboxydivorans Nor1]|uniref:Probable zinc-binding domain-containing protein n=1 Tax=Thermosinus carboxydivorans Nor1 TaxID=401526 RepID=A1HS45_9FIRM|nr:hypothetical protein TcarDRAFT_0661 [Thermosinus carboxydivorans Nor1]